MSGERGSRGWSIFLSWRRWGARRRSSFCGCESAVSWGWGREGARPRVRHVCLGCGLTRGRRAGRRIVRGTRRALFALLLLLVRSPAGGLVSRRAGVLGLVRSAGAYPILAHLVDGPPCAPQPCELTLGVGSEFGVLLFSGGHVAG